MRSFVLFFAMLITSSCHAQGSDKSPIYYEPHPDVLVKLKEYINASTKNDSKVKFAFQLSQEGNNRYRIGIISYDNGIIEDNDLIYSKVISKTNRFIKIGELDIPLFFSSDLSLADFGKQKMPDGRIASKWVLFNFDGYSITFDRNGIIYK